MHISDEGLVAGSVNRAELAAAYEAATDEAVRANLAAVGVQNGMVVEDGKLVDPSDVRPEGTVREVEPEPESEQDADSTRPAQSDNKAAWVDWAVTQGLEREDAEAFTKAELIDEYGDA